MKTISYFEGEQCKLGAAIALKNRLYVSGWSLSGYLVDIKKGKAHLDSKMAIVYEDGKAVGVSLQLRNGLTQCFTKKSFRRQGVGRMLTEPFRSEKSYGTWGLDEAEYFWKAVGYVYK